MQLLRTHLIKQPNFLFHYLLYINVPKQTEIDLKIVKSDALG